MRRTRKLHLRRGKVRLRRILPTKVRPREGLMTEPTAAVQVWRRERVLMPLTGHLRHLSNQLLELRKRAKAQPGLQIRLKLSVSSDDQRAGAFGLSDSSVAHPNLGHCPQIGDKIKIDIKARIYRA
jgi:hypothetical protein